MMKFQKYVSAVMAVFVLFSDVIVGIKTRPTVGIQRNIRSYDEGTGVRTSENFGMQENIRRQDEESEFMDKSSNTALDFSICAQLPALPPESLINNTEVYDLYDQCFANLGNQRTADGPNGCWQYWQDWNGTHCVCAEVNRCPEMKGHVCDNAGFSYNSMCDFQFAVCSGAVSTLRKLTVCDGCRYLRLSGSSLFEEDPNAGLGVFERVEESESVEYVAIDGSNIRVMKEGNTWHVGTRNSSGTFVMMKMYKSDYSEHVLEESRSGFYVIQQENGQNVWALDPFLHLECLSDEEVEAITRRRLFFLIASIVTAVTITVGTSLKVAQTIKGCLYFPDVCTWTKEIKEVLKPRVETKHEQFQREFGDVSNYREAIETVFGYTNDLKGNLIEIRRLYEALEKYSSSSLEHFMDFDDIAFDESFGSSLAEFEKFKDSVEMQFLFGLVGWGVGIAITMGQVGFNIGRAISLSATVAAGVGAVLAVLTVIVDIFLSYQQEKLQYENLKTDRHNLIRCDQQLDDANARMVTIQKELCTDLMVPISKFSQAALNLDNTDPRLRELKSFLERKNVFVEEVSRCENRDICRRINQDFLKELSENVKVYLDGIRKHKDQLIEKVEKAREVFMFLDGLKCDIIDNSPTPNNIYNFVTQEKPDTVQMVFRNEFEMMQVFAGRVLSRRSCYWGYNLLAFRCGAATIDNYRKSTVIAPCGTSPEMLQLNEQLSTDVRTNMAPCRIFKRANRDVVPDMSFLMTYISLFTLPAEKCYWGYQLNALRFAIFSDSDLNEALIDIMNLKSLSYLSASNIGVARTILVEDLKVNNLHFQNYLLCMVNRQVWASQFSCDFVPSQTECHIDSVVNQCS